MLLPNSAALGKQDISDRRVLELADGWIRPKVSKDFQLELLVS